MTWAQESPPQGCQVKTLGEHKNRAEIPVSVCCRLNPVKLLPMTTKSLTSEPSRMQYYPVFNMQKKKNRTKQKTKITGSETLTQEVRQSIGTDFGWSEMSALAENFLRVVFKWLRWHFMCF